MGGCEISCKDWQTRALVGSIIAFQVGGADITTNAVQKEILSKVVEIAAGIPSSQHPLCRHLFHHLTVYEAYACQY